MKISNVFRNGFLPLIFSAFLYFAQDSLFAQTSDNSKLVSAKILPTNCRFHDIGVEDSSATKITFNKAGDSLICTFVNLTNDTMYLYGTPYSEQIVYSKNLIRIRNKQLIIDLSEKVPHPNTYSSGMKQYQFFVLPPNCSQDFIFLIPQITKVINRKNLPNLIDMRFSYYSGFNIYSINGDIYTGWILNKSTTVSSCVRNL